MENFNEITDLNPFDLLVPKDGTTAIVSEGAKFWAPIPDDADPAGRFDDERWLPMVYEPVRSSDGKLLDVVAWHEGDPSQWWLRTGRGQVLGAEELARVSWTDLPTILVSTPAGWRYLDQKGTNSVCILDLNTCDTSELFSVVWGAVICASNALRHRLEERHRECGGAALNTAVDELL